MIPTSLLFQEAMALSRTQFSTVDIVKNDVVLAAGIPLTGGTITTDLDANTRYDASGVEMAWDKGEGEPPLVNDGRRVRVRVGLSSIGIEESIQLGEYLLYDFEDNFRGHYSLTLKGMETLVIEDRFIRPRTPPYGQSTTGTITKLITESVPDATVVVRCAKDRKITSTAPWEKERWDAITELAVSIEAQVYCGHDGRWYIDDLPDVANLRPVVKVITGPTGVVIEQSRTNSRENIRNAWAVSGQSSDSAIPPVFGFAYDSDPTSLTYYGTPGTQPLPTQAAQLLLNRINDDRTVWADWTWDKAPTLVKQNAPALLAAYRASIVPAPGPAPVPWLTSYIDSHGGAGTITTTATVTPPETVAAQTMLTYLNNGGLLHEDWSWNGMPEIVGDYNDDLLALYLAALEEADPDGRTDAATQILWRYMSGQDIFEDWTWVGAPPVVYENNDYLLSEFYRVYRYSRFPGNYREAMTWLANYAYRPIKAFLQGYINDNPPEEITTEGTAPDDVQAAQLIRDRLTGGLRVFGDWTWAGAPSQVIENADDLLEAFQDANKAQAIVWLGTYIGAHGGGGDPIFTGTTFGKTVGFYSSQFFTSDAQATAYAQRKLANSLAFTSQMKLSAGPLPMLEAGDAVMVSDELGNPLPHQMLNQTTMPLDGTAWNAVCMATGTLDGGES